MQINLESYSFCQLNSNSLQILVFEITKIPNDCLNMKKVIVVKEHSLLNFEGSLKTEI